MSDCCQHAGCNADAPRTRRFRTVLWIALIANAAMFVIEAGASWRAESSALLADAVDFLGDSANYAVSLLALAAGAVWRSRVALLKGWTMAGYGVAVLAVAAWNVWRGAAPEPATMAAIGFAALVVNVAVAALLYAFRDGDANMRSVWLCSRNDAIGNVAVMLAAAGVFGTGTIWPDIAVAGLLAVLGLTAARSVIRQAQMELAAGVDRGRAAPRTHALELRVPPLVLTALIAGAMALAAVALPGMAVELPGHRGIAAGLLALGIGVAVAGVLAFRRARTTVDPRAPAATSALVVRGIYRLTRNPMYVGFALALAALAVWLQHPAAAAGVAAFVAYIDRFQVRPEERVLERHFGAAYRGYARTVRRWV